MLEVSLIKPDGNWKTLEEIEKEVLEAHLLREKNVSKITRYLGIGRSTFYRKIKQYSLLEGFEND